MHIRMYVHVHVHTLCLYGCIQSLDWTGVDSLRYHTNTILVITRSLRKYYYKIFHIRRTEHRVNYYIKLSLETNIHTPECCYVYNSEFSILEGVH